MKHISIFQKKSIHQAVFVAACMLIVNLSIAQQQKNIVNPPAPLEVEEGEYIPVSKDDMAKSPAYKYSIPGFFTTQVNIDEDGNNIVGDAANEPSIAVDPNDPSRIAIGWRQFATINNSYRQAGNAFSSDGGDTWTAPEALDPNQFRSDPVLVADNNGNFFYNSLAVTNSVYTCDVFTRTNGGASWEGPTYAYGGDKQWMTVDNSGGMGDGHLYAFWTSAYSICEPNFFSRSSNSNESWEYCTFVEGYPYWGTLTVDADGNLFVAGTQWNGFIVAKSSNAQDPNEDITWDFMATVDLDGGLVGFGGYDCPNPSGLLGQTIIDIDRGGGPYNGNVYVLASVERQSNNDPCDVMFTKSENGGLSFSTPIRVNDDPSTNAYQWFGTMSVAPNGRIDVVWLDTREMPGEVWSALYYAYSEDGGDSFSENVKLSELFNPHEGWPQQDKMGDYFDMVSDNNKAHLAWANTLNGEQDTYYGRISWETTGLQKNEPASGLVLSQNYPNPVTTETRIQYYLPQSGQVLLSLYDLQGRLVYQPVKEIESAGQHTVTIYADDLPAGTYYYTIETTTGRATKKMMIIK